LFYPRFLELRRKGLSYDREVRVNRSPEAFKQAICQAFTNPPAECNQTLSTETASPGIGPLTGGSTSSGSCG